MHPLVDLLLRALADAQAEGDVVPHRHVLEGGVVLEHEADAAVLGRHARSRPRPGSRPAGVGLLEARDHSQQRRLAAAARPEQRGQRAVGHLDRDVVEGDEVPELLAGVLNGCPSGRFLSR